MQLGADCLFLATVGRQARMNRGAADGDQGLTKPFEVTP
jgi:hypothetical protein